MQSWLFWGFLLFGFDFDMFKPIYDKAHKLSTKKLNHIYIIYTLIII